MRASAQVIPLRRRAASLHGLGFVYFSTPAFVAAANRVAAAVVKNGVVPPSPVLDDRTYGLLFDGFDGWSTNGAGREAGLYPAPAPTRARLGALWVKPVLPEVTTNLGFTPDDLTPRAKAMFANSSFIVWNAESMASWMASAFQSRSSTQARAEELLGFVREAFLTAQYSVRDITYDVSGRAVAFPPPWVNPYRWPADSQARWKAFADDVEARIVAAGFPTIPWTRGMDPVPWSPQPFAVDPNSNMAGWLKGSATWSTAGRAIPVDGWWLDGLPPPAVTNVMNAKWQRARDAAVAAKDAATVVLADQKIAEVAVIAATADQAQRECAAQYAFKAAAAATANMGVWAQLQATQAATQNQQAIVADQMKAAAAALAKLQAALRAAQNANDAASVTALQGQIDAIQATVQKQAADMKQVFDASLQAAQVQAQQAADQAAKLQATLVTQIVAVQQEKAQAQTVAAQQQAQAIAQDPAKAAAVTAAAAEQQAKYEAQVAGLKAQLADSSKAAAQAQAVMQAQIDQAKAAAVAAQAAQESALAAATKQAQAANDAAMAKVQAQADAAARAAAEAQAAQSVNASALAEQAKAMQAALDSAVKALQTANEHQQAQAKVEAKATGSALTLQAGAFDLSGILAFAKAHPLLIGAGALVSLLLLRRPPLVVAGR